MATPQLSVRSATARDLARALALRERRPVAAIVEDALRDYAAKHISESAGAFLHRMRSLGETSDDTDLDLMIAENRKPHRALDL